MADPKNFPQRPRLRSARGTLTRRGRGEKRVMAYCGRGGKCAEEREAFGGKVAKQRRRRAQAPAPRRAARDQLRWAAKSSGYRLRLLRSSRPRCGRLECALSQRKVRKGFDAKGAKFLDRIHRIDRIFFFSHESSRIDTNGRRFFTTENTEISGRKRNCQPPTDRRMRPIIRFLARSWAMAF